MTLNSNLNSAENEIEPFRKVWHHYLVTKIEGKAVWRYRILDFSKTIVPGKLIATLTVPGPDGRPHTYMVEAFIAAPRILFVQKVVAGTEAPVIHVYPFGTEHFRTVIAGTAFLQSWEGDRLGVPVMMSTSPIDLGETVPAIGTLAESHFSKLDEIWGKQADQLGLLVKGRASL
jgi:hypothetical protein